MRHLVDHRKLGRTTSHRRALLRNMATSLIITERIETTLPKAKELRCVADRMVTLGKRGTLHARRHAARYVHGDEALKKLFEQLAPRFKDRQGGYTRIYQYGTRRGDAADMAAIEYLGYQLPVPVKDKKEDKKKEVKNVEKKKEAAKASLRKEEKKAEKNTGKKEGAKQWKWNIFGRSKKG